MPDEEVDDYMDNLEFTFMVFGTEFDKLWEQLFMMVLASAFHMNCEPNDVALALIESFASSEDMREKWIALRDEWYPVVAEEIARIKDEGF